MAKGEYLGTCYRSVCDSGPATWFNHSTRMYYCRACARLINVANRVDAMAMYGHDLCTQSEQITEKLTIMEFIGEKAVYDRDSQVIFGQRGEGLQMIAQFYLHVRAWAAFQKLFKTPQEAAAFQDELGQFIADAINAKLHSPPPSGRGH